MRALIPSRPRRPDRRGVLLSAAGLLAAAVLAPALADQNGARSFVQDVGDRTVAALRRAGASNQRLGTSCIQRALAWI